MRSSGNPDAAYSVAEKARVGLTKVVDFTGAQSGNLLQLSLLVPAAIWLFSWVVSLFNPSSGWSIVGTLHMVLLFGMIWGFMSRTDSVARVFPGIFWMHTFVRNFSELSSFGWSYYLAQTILFFFVAYCVCGILGTSPLRKHPMFKRSRPIIQLVTTVLVVLGTVLGVFFFFLNIQVQYYDFSSLLLLLGSAMMLLLLSGDFKTEKWMKPVEKYGPLLFLALLALFGVFDGLLSLVALQNTLSSSLQLLFRPLLINLFTASFILPASFIATHHLHRASLPESSKDTDKQATAVEETLPAEPEFYEELPVEAATDDVAADPSLNFVQPEYREAQEDPEAWQNPLQEEVNAPSAWQPLPFDLTSIGAFKSDLSAATDSASAPVAASVNPTRPLPEKAVPATHPAEPLAPFLPTRVDVDVPASSLPVSTSSAVEAPPIEHFRLHPHRVNGQQEIVQEQAVQPFVAPSRVDPAMKDVQFESQPRSVLTAETKVLPRVTEADLAAAGSQPVVAQPNRETQDAVPPEPVKPQIRRVDTEM